MTGYSRTERLRQVAAALWEATWGPDASTVPKEGADFRVHDDDRGRACTQTTTSVDLEPTHQSWSSAYERVCNTTSPEQSSRPTKHPVSSRTGPETFSLAETPNIGSELERIKHNRDRWTTPLQGLTVTGASTLDASVRSPSTRTYRSLVNRSPVWSQHRSAFDRLGKISTQTPPQHRPNGFEQSAAFIEQWLMLELTAEKENADGESSWSSEALLSRHQSSTKWVQEGVSLLHALEQDEQQRFAEYLRSIEQLGHHLHRAHEAALSLRKTTPVADSNSFLLDASNAEGDQMDHRTIVVPSKQDAFKVEHLSERTTELGLVHAANTTTTKQLSPSLEQFVPTKADERAGALASTALERTPALSKSSLGPGVSNQATPATKSVSDVSSGRPMSEVISVVSAPKNTAAPVAKSDVTSQAQNETLLPADIQLVLDRFHEAQDLAEQYQRDQQFAANRLQLRKRINLAVNQIGLSLTSVYQKASVLTALLQQALAATTTTTSASAALSAWLHVQIAQRIVAEGAEQVVLSLPSSFALGAVLVRITQTTPSMRSVVLGAFYHQCPYTMPHWYRRRPDESPEHFRIRMGYRKPDEPFERYMERMGGYISLFAAMCQTALQNAPPNPYGLGLLWTWIARLINTKPRRMTALLLVNALEVAGHAMSLRYGTQFGKLLQLIRDEIVPNLPRDAPPGPTARLVHWVEDALAHEPAVCPGQKLPLQDSQNL
ncbi:Nuclear pore complex nucleoporin component [Cyanidiococcus yangmingshanensis]|uniref:mRNA export factor GLE1 n=1 Tax=Cyanidiococcus yangmingshanensis TaxID=2690220 RepID=A0A7J7ILL9_9RHOD|nr:Nuclear pore complex nucleoporin component [Cyanidiococcus yangmingshanensis]